MAEDIRRSALYAIRWEILVMAVSLILIAVVVLTIPNDFSDKLLKERAAEREAMEQLNSTASINMQANITAIQP